MLSPRKKEVTYTIIGNLTLQVVTAICGFILPPLIISTFSSSVNGMVASISQFITYLNIVEVGVGGAAISALYKPLALNDVEKRNGILSATARFYNRSGLVFTSLIVVLAVVYPLIIGTQVDALQASLMVLVLGITGAAEFFLVGKYRVLLTADKKLYVLSFVQMGALIISTAFSVVLIKRGCGLVLVKLVAALVYLSRFLFLSRYVHAKYVNLHFSAKADAEAIKQSKNVLVHQIGALVVFNSPLVILTFFCSLSDVSVYAVYAMVFNAVNQLLGAFNNGMQSFFGESLVSEPLEHTRKIFNTYETLFFAIVGLFYSLAYLLVIPFMNLYTQNLTDANYIQPTVALLFVAVGVLNNVRNPGNRIIDAAGDFKKTQWRSVAESLINVTASIICTIYFGFIGVLIGSICSYTYRSADIIIYAAKNVLTISFVPSFLKILVLLLYYGIGIKGIVYFAVSVPTYAAWVVYACVAGFALLLPLGIFFFLYIAHSKKRSKKYA